VTTEKKTKQEISEKTKKETIKNEAVAAAEIGKIEEILVQILAIDGTNTERKKKKNKKKN
jgi:hypothetical protein